MFLRAGSQSVFSGEMVLNKTVSSVRELGSPLAAAVCTVNGDFTNSVYTVQN